MNFSRHNDLPTIAGPRGLSLLQLLLLLSEAPGSR